MSKRVTGYYLSPGDNVRSLAPLLRRTVETNTRGNVLQIDPKNEKFVFVEFPEAKVKGWIKATDVEVIPAKWSPEERRRRSSMNKVSAKIRIYPQGYARSLLSDAYDKGLVFDAKVIDPSAGLIRCPEDEAAILIEKYDGKDFGSGPVKVTKAAVQEKKKADQGEEVFQKGDKVKLFGPAEDWMVKTQTQDVGRVAKVGDGMCLVQFGSEEGWIDNEKLGLVERYGSKKKAERNEVLEGLLDRNELERKPDDWEQIQEMKLREGEKEAINELPAFDSFEVYNSEDPDFQFRPSTDKFMQKMPQWFVFRNLDIGREFLVDTEGANYARYVGRLPENWRPKKKIINEMGVAPTASKKQALDQFGKKYLQNYLKGTGYGEQIMRVACNDVEKVLRAEDVLTPIALRAAYQVLSKKYTEQGGFKFVRAIRQEVISSGILKRMEG